ncbi:sulfatase [Draconibacterium sp.]|uniref:sulfatase n=1 Tax=Draconibacterium sp. TaxID=1965318 RepID=UPI003566EC2D
MKKQVCWILIIGVAGLLFSCSLQKTEKQKTKKPNIVFILADDMGWADLPVYGNRFNEAPRLAKLAEEGTRFTNAYAACPVCSPTRASIQSGQYPARVGVIDFIPGHWRPFEEVVVPKNRTQHLPTDITSLGEAMKTAGYRTGYFGKWHLGFWDEHHPSKRGYDSAYEYKGGGFFNSKFSPHYEVNNPKQPLSDVLTDMSVNFLEENKDSSFFLFLSHYDVHVQLDADSALIDKYLKKEKVDNYPCNAIYAAMVESVDKSVGRVLDKLDELGLAENTIVLFFSDNGGLKSRFDEIPLIDKSKQHIYENDSLLYIASSNTPLRAEKGTVYEGGIREPFIVRWPGKIGSGLVSDALISSVDFYPTFMALAEANMPEIQVFDGKNILPELMGNNREPERALFWHYPVYHHDVPKSVIRKGDWKLIENLVDGSFELYNLKEDISETNNLAEVNIARLKELKTELKAWQTNTGAALPVKNHDFDEKKRKLWKQHPDTKTLFKKPEPKTANDIIPQ